MARIFLDIRDTVLGALIFDGDNLLYDCSFDSQSIAPADAEGQEPDSLERMLFQKTEGEKSLLSSILTRISKDANVKVTSGYLLVADSALTYETITLPKIKPEDSSIIIARKFNPTGSVKLHVSLIEESTQNKTWSVEYLPAELARKYLDSFKTAGIKLKGITTSSHVAIHAVPGEFVMDAGRVYAMYDFSAVAVEGLYFLESRLIHNERFKIDKTASSLVNVDEEQYRKMKLFKILDSIYRINANFEFSNPDYPIHQLLLCGTHPQLHEIADSLSAAMSAEGFILGDFETVSPVAGKYALLIGYANALQQFSAVDFLHNDTVQRRSLRFSAFNFLYILAALLAFASVAFREDKHRKLAAELAKETQNLSQLKTAAADSIKFGEKFFSLQKTLAGNSFFYGLFRDFANNLPDGTFLKGIHVKQSGSAHTIEIVAVTKKNSDLHTRKVLSRLQNYLSTSTFLRMSKNPVITVTGKDNDKTVEMKFFCELVAK